MFRQTKKELLIVFLFSSFIAAQVMIGTTGLGSFSKAALPSTLGNTAGFAHDLGAKISTSDPSSWRHLRFTLVRANYSGSDIENGSGTVQSQSGLDHLQFIIPIKNDWGIGFGVEPYLEQSYSIRSEELTKVFWADSIYQNGSKSSAGGLSSAYFGIGTHIKDNYEVGIKLIHLYGAQRLKTSLSLNSDNFIQWTSQVYSGDVFKLYFAVNDLPVKKHTANVRFAMGLTSVPVKMTQKKYQLFLDSNQGGISNDVQDNYDTPYPSLNLDPIASAYHNTHAPLTFEFSGDVNFGKNSMADIQLSYWKETADNAGLLTLNNDPLDYNLNGEFSLHKYPSQYLKSFSSRLQYTAGVYGSQYAFSGITNPVNELGLKSGLSIKFGPAENFLDFNYSFGLRSGGEISAKSIRKFSIGLTISDLWFVKRREI